MRQLAGVTALGLFFALLRTVAVAAEPSLPEGFETEVVADGFQVPTAIAFAPGERIFVAEKRGLIWIVDHGVRLSEPFLDLRNEVNDARDRGMLGVAVDPEFQSSPWVYVLYVVDPVFGPPEEPGTEPTFGRLTRYLADPEHDGNRALLSSRHVLIGAEPGQGFIHCSDSHAVGTIRFAADGTLLVGSGDGAAYFGVDAGGRQPECFAPGLFDKVHDIGAFRAQFLGSPAGKILRIDRATGQGLPSNPFFTGNPDDVRSKVWVNGLRNPFRFCLRPESGPPERIYAGDVGWWSFEEIDVARGGENFGWPCYEGAGEQKEYIDAAPTHSDCTTIESPDNPGPLTPPLITWHHRDPARSMPPGFRGRCALGGAFYVGRDYPAEYEGRYFFGDYSNDWIRVLTVDEEDRFVDLRPFGEGMGRLVALEADPVTGDLVYVSIQGSIRRIVYPRQGACCVGGHCRMTREDDCSKCGDRDPPWRCDGDVDGDGQVNPVDVGLVQSAFGSTEREALCRYDVDCDGLINPVDVGIVQALFGTCLSPRDPCGAGRWFSGKDCESIDCP